MGHLKKFRDFTNERYSADKDIATDFDNFEVEDIEYNYKTNIGKIELTFPKGKYRESTFAEFTYDPLSRNLDFHLKGYSEDIYFEVLKVLVKYLKKEEGKNIKKVNDKPLPEEVMESMIESSKYFLNESKFKIGDKVKVNDGSGLASNKIAKVVSPKMIKTDGRSIPQNISGAYKPIDWKREVAIQYEDGELDTMFISHLKKVDEVKESILNEEIRKYGYYKVNINKIADQFPEQTVKIVKQMIKRGGGEVCVMDVDRDRGIATIAGNPMDAMLGTVDVPLSCFYDVFKTKREPDFPHTRNIDYLRKNEGHIKKFNESLNFVPFEHFNSESDNFVWALTVIKNNKKYSEKFANIVNKYAKLAFEGENITSYKFEIKDKLGSIVNKEYLQDVLDYLIKVKHMQFPFSNVEKIQPNIFDKLISSYKNYLTRGIVEFLQEHENRDTFKEFYNDENKKLWKELQVQSGKDKFKTMIDNKYKKDLKRIYDFK